MSEAFAAQIEAERAAQKTQAAPGPTVSRQELLIKIAEDVAIAILSAKLTPREAMGVAGVVMEIVYTRAITVQVAQKFREGSQK